jgi:hypothetical protein
MFSIFNENQNENLQVKMSHTFSHNRVVTSYLPLLLTQSVSETYHPNALVKKITSKSILFV